MLTQQHFGFHPLLYKDVTIHSLLNDLYNNFDCRSYTVTQELERHGLGVQSILWFCSCLSDHSQFVCVNVLSSNLLNVNVRVVQGSFLGSFYVYSGVIIKRVKILHFC